MRIIDLLNKIANGEEIPKKIKIDKWEHDDECEDVEYELFHRLYFGDFELNDEVEIIEEETKPLTKQDLEALGYACGEIRKCFENGWNKSLENKPFKEDKEIEKEELFIIDESMTKSSLVAWQKANNGIFKKKIDELIDKVNSLENKQ